MCVLIESEKLKNNRPVTMHSLIRLCLHPLAGGKVVSHVGFRVLWGGAGSFFFPFFSFSARLTSHLGDFHYFFSFSVSLSTNEHCRTCWTHLNA